MWLAEILQASIRRWMAGGHVKEDRGRGLEFRLLGSVEAWSAGRLIELGPPRQRGVLAALAVDARRLVPRETIVDRIWGERPPARARDTLYVYIARIRRLLAEASGDGSEPAQVVSRSGGGYVLDVAPEQIDLHRVSHLVGRARDPVCPVPKRVALLREALDLHRGAPLAGIPGEWAERVRKVWARHHLDAVAAWGEAELRLGNGHDVIDRLTRLVADNPLAESVVAVLIQALYTNGRGADALNCYVDLRTRLVEELGADPGPDLQRLHLSILRGEPLPTPAPDVATVSHGEVAWTAPAQLPLGVRGFVGRASELAHLDTLLDPDGRPNPGAAADPGPARRATAVGIAVLSGTGGVGKTALAVHWAHRTRERFPDGQLYVNLRGFAPTGPAVNPAEVLRRFFDALNVPAQRIPPNIDAQTALYRTLLAERRMLILLDNARDVDQVRSLLPGAPGCVVLVTSRDQLTSLVAAEAAYPLPLELFTASEARDLLTFRIGADRIAAESQAVDEIVAHCARLPLALAIVAARAATHPELPLATFRDDLRAMNGRFDALSTGDPSTDLLAVFSSSYRTLTPDGARLFRLLGLHPGPDTTAAAVASLAALPPQRVRPLLTELTRVQLLTEHRPGRYGFHDLLRAYATDLVATVDTATDRETARHRLLDHYLHTARHAAMLLLPMRDPITIAAAQTGVRPEHLADASQAQHWFDSETDILLAAIQQADRSGFYSHVHQLAWTLTTFLNRRSRFQQLLEVQGSAAIAARRLRDLNAEAAAYRSLGFAHAQLGSQDTAEADFQRALDLYREAGDLMGQAHTHVDLPWLLDRQGRHLEGLRHSEQAVELFRAVGHRSGEAKALNSIGWHHVQLGDYEQALAFCGQALTVLQELGNRAAEAATWDSLGYAHHHLGRHDQAAACYQHALDIWQEIGDRLYAAQTLNQLGDTYAAAVNSTAAQDAWQQALDILDNLQHPEATGIRAKLHQAHGTVVTEV
jgi:DNA-binding SARP family transcriptional activator/tetratricopeptide (TPR) repeat protein